MLNQESPPRLESTDLLLVLISVFWELLLLCRFLSFWNIFHHSLIQRRPLQNRTLFYRLQRFHRQQSAQIASFPSNMVNSCQKNKVPHRHLRSGSDTHRQGSQSHGSHPHSGFYFQGNRYSTKDLKQESEMI